MIRQNQKQEVQFASFEHTAAHLPDLCNRGSWEMAWK